jgi:hypothetical protein
MQKQAVILFLSPNVSDSGDIEAWGDESLY